MKYTYILCACYDKKEYASASLVCSFSEKEDEKVFNYIEEHQNAFFDGTKKEKERKLKSLFHSTIEKSNIMEAINSNLDIYAMVQQIPNI